MTHREVYGALGIVSLLMDVSPELIHSLLPVFLVSVIGAGTPTVGLIEGVAEATAAFNKVFPGFCRTASENESWSPSLATVSALSRNRYFRSQARPGKCSWQGSSIE